MAKKFKPVDCDPFGERRLNAPGDGDWVVVVVGRVD